MHCLQSLLPNPGIGGVELWNFERWLTISHSEPLGQLDYIYDPARISKVINMPMRGFIPTQMTINPCCDAAGTVGATTMDIQTGG